VKGKIQRMLRLLRDRPILSSLLGFACCFIAVHGAVLSPSRTEQRIWPVYMVVRGSCYAVATFLLCLRYSQLAGPEPRQTRFALALVPAVLGAGAAVFEWPAWSAWLGLGVSAVLLTATAWLSVRARTR
jgi:hypothetical protein